MAITLTQTIRINSYQFESERDFICGVLSACNALVQTHDQFWPFVGK